MRTSILAWVVFGCLGAVAQQERIDTPDCNALSGYANGGNWNEFHFEVVERVNDALANDGNAFKCKRGKDFFGKEVYGYDRKDSGTAQSIIPCSEPGSQYSFSARARLSGNGTPGRVFAEFINGAGVKTNAVEFLVSTTNYTDFSQTFTVPSDAVWCHVWILQNDPQDAAMLVDSVSLKSADPDDTPAVPTGLAIDDKSSSMVRLQWNAVAGANGYLIERKHDSDNSTKWRTVVRTFEGGGQTNFLDAVDTSTSKVLEPGVKYDYRISAFGDYGNSAASSVVSVTLDTRTDSPGGTTYYIDATGGSDSNAGTSEGTAWQSFIPLDRLNLAAGDSVFLKRGESWNEPMNLHGGGAAGSEVVVSSYGSSTNKPIINVESRAHAAIRMIDVSHVRISDLEIANFHPFHRKVRRYALEAGSWQAVGVTNLHFNNLFVNGVRCVANRGDGGSASDGRGGAGLRVVGNIRSEDTKEMIYDVSITDCRFEDVEMFSMHLHDIDGLVVFNNVAERSGFCAILTRRLFNAVISHNRFYDGGYYETCDDNAHIGFYGGSDVVIEHNLIDTTHNTASGQSMNFDGTDNYTIQYNYMKDSEAGSFVLNHQASNNVFRYNVSEGIGETQWMRNLGALDTHIYNNTVYLKPGQDVNFIYNGHTINAAEDPATNVWCHNNIFYSAGGTITGDLINSIPGSSGIFISNNVYYGTFTELPVEDGHPLYADPQFEGPIGSGSVDGFQLLETSPYIESGIIISNNGGLDYWGTPVSNRPSIGAHQPVGISAPTLIWEETFAGQTMTDPADNPAKNIAKQYNDLWIESNGGVTNGGDGARAILSTGGSGQSRDMYYILSGDSIGAGDYELTLEVDNIGNNGWLDVAVFDVYNGTGTSGDCVEYDFLAAQGVTFGATMGPSPVSGAPTAKTNQLGTTLRIGGLADNDVPSVVGMHTIPFSYDGNGDLVLAFIAGANVSNGKSSYFDSLQIRKVSDNSAYSTWSNSYSLVYGPEGDDDVDGLNNLAEYGIGGNPTNGFVDGNLPTFGSGSAGLEYIYAYRADDATLDYTLETTTNLISNVWTNTGYSVTGTNQAGGTFGYVTNLIDSAESKRFIRLKIDQH